MRNLKRVLSLALASVMLLGMMVIGAGAADYTDTDSISQKEAAQVMEAIGVMQGNDKGEFLPTAELTREAAAKIITYLLLGKKTADGLTTGKAPFDDVEAGRWSAGSIAYCAANGIISGDGKGNFFPTATVTGTQFAKMLLGALGYKADTEGYTGANYVLNVATAVTATGLNKGLDSNLSATLTREEAARMAMNALRTRLVQYTGGVSIPSDNGNIVVGAVRSYIEKENSKQGEIKYQLFMDVYQTNLTYKDAQSGAYNRPSHSWLFGKDEVGTYGNSVDLTYTVKPTAATLKSDMGGYSLKDGAPVYVNGNYVGTVDAQDDLRAYMGAGRLVELYADSEYNISSVIVVDTVLAEISSINTASKEVRITTKSFTGALPGNGINADVNVNGGQVRIVKESENKDMYAKLAEMKVEDLVLVTFDAGKVASVAVPESFTGTFTAQASSGKRTIGGNTYDDAYAAKFFTTDATGKDTSKTSVEMDLGNDYICYTDAYGNVIYAKADATSNTKYAYVMDADTEGSRVNNSMTYSVKLLFTDGTQSWVQVNNINNESAKATNSSFDSAFTSLKAKKSFVSYVVRADGSYALTTTGLNTTKFNNQPIDKNDVDVLVGTVNAKGNSQTVFLVATGDSTYKSYTGIRNIPGWTGVDGEVLYVSDSSSVARVILVSAGGGNTAEKDYIYILNSKSAKSYVDGQTVYTYDAVVDGKITTVATTLASMKVGAKLIDRYSGDYVAAVSDATENIDKSGCVINSVTQSVVDGTTVNSLTYNDGVLTDTNRTPKALDFMTSDKVSVIGVHGTDAYEIAVSQLASYTITNYVMVLDSDEMVTTLIFTY